MRRCIWIVALISIAMLVANAQVKSIQGGAGRLVTSHSSPAQPKPTVSNGMTNQDVVDLVNLGLADDIIIQKIQTTPVTNFDTSVAGLKALKSTRVSDAIIRVMLSPHVPLSSSTTLASSSAEVSGLPKEIGVYVMLRNSLTEVEPEIVGWQTGGVGKRIATIGFTRGHINGKIMRSHSPLRVANPVEFVIRTPEGTSVTEYQLLSLYEKGNRREFRAVTGGILHASGGAERTAIEFKSEKIGDRTWKIRFSNLSPGEYGFLPPGISSASISSSGKMYTFGVRE